MAQQDDSVNSDYPHGRGYGHDYMRGGEVFGGYGYAERDEYHKTRGEVAGLGDRTGGTESGDGQSERTNTPPPVGGVA
jgi:hypothetical protein